MKNTEKKYKGREKKEKDSEVNDDLDSFIEKRKIQNDALKKIMGMDVESLTTKTKKEKTK